MCLGEHKLSQLASDIIVEPGVRTRSAPLVQVQNVEIVQLRELGPMLQN